MNRAEKTTTIVYDEQGPDAEIITYSHSVISSLRENEAAREIGNFAGVGVCFKLPKELIIFG